MKCWHQSFFCSLITWASILPRRYQKKTQMFRKMATNLIWYYIKAFYYHLFLVCWEKPWAWLVPGKTKLCFSQFGQDIENIFQFMVYCFAIFVHGQSFLFFLYWWSHLTLLLISVFGLDFYYEVSGLLWFDLTWCTTPAWQISPCLIKFSLCAFPGCVMVARQTLDLLVRVQILPGEISLICYVVRN